MLKLVILVAIFHLSKKTSGHILDEVPLIDGHNDLAWNLYTLERNNLDNVDFLQNLKDHKTWGLEPQCTEMARCQTDVPRLRQGKFGAVFWSVYTDCGAQYADIVAKTLDQIDVIKRFVQKYSEHFQFVTDAAGIMTAFRNGQIGSLIGVEGGHSIDSRAGVLRMYYDLGVRYMTVTHECNTPWADGSIVDITNKPVHNLTEFGKKIIREMNRLGMLADISHVSHNVMIEVLLTSRAPVIFSHSGAWEVYNHRRNVRNDVLTMLKENQGIIMMHFAAVYLEPDQDATMVHVIDHINYIVDLIGHDHIGIGGDYDGVPRTPTGLEDVSKVPDLFDALAKNNATRWTNENLKKLAGENFLRVFEHVEMVRDSLIDEKPMQEWISMDDLKNVEEQDRVWQCRTLLDEHKHFYQID